MTVVHFTGDIMETVTLKMGDYLLPDGFFAGNTYKVVGKGVGYIIENGSGARTVVTPSEVES